MGLPTVSTGDAAGRPLIPVVPPGPGDPGNRWLAQWDRCGYLELDADFTAPGEARRLVRRTLPAWGLGDLLDEAEIVATEIATNAVAAVRELLPARLPVRVWLLGCATGACVAVWDAVERLPVPRAAGPQDEDGRGLLLVAELSKEWDSWLAARPYTGKVTRAIFG